MTQADIPHPGSSGPSTGPAPAAPRRKMNWWVVGAFIAAGILAIYLMESYSRPLVSTTNHPAVGKQPSALHLEPLNVDEAAVTLESLRGNVVVVSFFTVARQTARGEVNMLTELTREWGHERVRILPVSCLPDASQEGHASLKSETEAFLKQIGNDTLTVYSDPDRTTREAFRQLGAFDGTYPSTIILDSTGRVLAVMQGFHLVHSPRDIRAVLTQELKR